MTVPIGVVPHAAASEPPDADWLGAAGLDLGDRFVVHSVANWTPRKQPALAIEAFARAFTRDDDAVLVMRTDRAIAATEPDPPGPPHRRRLTPWAVASILHRHAPCADVRLVHDIVTDAQLAALGARSNCWLSLPHAEGWDLGAFDAAVAGTPVITTAHGGPLEYLDPASPLLIAGSQSSMPPLAHLAHGTWVDPDLDAAVAALRSVAANPSAARDAAAAHARQLRRDHAPAAIAARFINTLADMGIGTGRIGV